MITFSSTFLFVSNTVEKLRFEAHVGEEGLRSSRVSIGTEVPRNGWTNSELPL